jgi:hypothetical protein
MCRIEPNFLEQIQTNLNNCATSSGAGPIRAAYCDMPLNNCPNAIDAWSGFNTNE